MVVPLSVRRTTARCLTLLVAVAWGWHTAASAATDPSLAGALREQAAALRLSPALRGSSGAVSRRHPTLAYALFARAYPYMDATLREELSDVVRFTPTPGGWRADYPLRGAAASAQTVKRTRLTEHFEIIQFAEGGPDDDFMLNLTAQLVEEVYAYEVAAPPPNRAVPFADPIVPGERYRITIRDQGGFVYGITFPTACEEDRCESTVEVDDDFDFLLSGQETQEQRRAKITDAMKITLAHEFFHAIQFAHYRLLSAADEQRVRLDIWAVEGGAVWMEDEVYHDIDDYALTYLPSFFQFPDKSWTSTNNSFNPSHPYGTVLYFKAITEYFTTPALIRDFYETWTTGQFTRAIAALETSLKKVNAGALDVVHQAWLGALGGQFADSTRFPEDVAVLRTFATLPRTESVRLCELCTFIIELDTGGFSRATDVDFLVSGLSDLPVKATLLHMDTGRQTTQVPLVPEDLPGGSTVRRAVFRQLRRGQTRHLYLVISAGLGATTGAVAYHVSEVPEQPERSARVPLYKGWNLLAVPVVPFDTNPGNFFGAKATVLYSANTTEGVRHFSPGEEGFRQMDTQGRSYFVFNDGLSRSVAISGAHGTGPVTVPLLPGYNLIGNPALVPLDLLTQATVQTASGEKATLSQALSRQWLGPGLFVLDAPTQTYKMLSTWRLPPYQGAWLTATRALTLQLTPSP